MKSIMPNKFDPGRRAIVGYSLATLAGIALGAGIKEGSKIPKEFSEQFVFPHTQQADYWNQEQKLAYAKQALIDYYTFGMEGVNKRKFWYEFVEKHNIKPQKHSISCEFKSLECLLALKGISVFNNGEKLSEQGIIDRVPISLNNNPLRGRPENLDAPRGLLPPQPYGILPKALAGSIQNDLPSNFNLIAQDFRDFMGANGKQQYVERLRQTVPSVFWFQLYPEQGNAFEFVDEETQLRIPVAPTEHAGVTLMANENNLMYIDPINLGIYRDDINNIADRAEKVGMGLLTAIKS